MPRVDVLARVRRSPAFTTARSVEAAANHEFIKAAGSGKLKAAGIKSYITDPTHPGLIYVFHPEFRVVGTRDQIYAYIGDLLPRATVDQYIDQFGFTLNTLQTQSPVELFSKYMAESKKTRAAQKKVFDIAAPYAPYAKIVSFATQLGIKGTDLAGAPLVLSTLVASQKGRSSSRNLLDRVKELLTDPKSIGKVMDVSKMTSSGAGARSIPAPKKPNSSKIGPVNMIPVVSDNYANYVLAMGILQELDAGRRSFEFDNILRVASQMFGGVAPAPVPVAPVVSPVRAASPVPIRRVGSPVPPPRSPVMRGSAPR
jgi:hypothetical protein